MKRSILLSFAGSGLCVALTASGATRYVNLNNPTPAAPYTTWVTAATDIQTAVDVAEAGDDILVTNGVYQTGAREVYGMSNRVAVIKPVTVRSVNGPSATSIVGSGPIGPTAVRCAYLTNGALLAGFTLTNGATQFSGDYSTNQSGGGVWCESPSAVVSNCILTGNSATYGGGAYYGTLNNCALMSNLATGAQYPHYSSGGGAYSAALNNCTLSWNSAYNGGGAYSATLNNSTLTGNSASEGGGAYFGTLNDCTLTDNSAIYNGGGAWAGTLNNCSLTGNVASYGDGGGAYGSALKNCTLTGNSARYSGGGAYSAMLNNCIVYYNSSLNGANHSSSTLNYCCTTPLPAAGTGNLDAEPQLASASHVSVASPCRGRGSAAYSSGVDIDGEPWVNPPAIGCDEYWSGSVTGAIIVAIDVSYTNVAMDFKVDFQSLIGGRLSASRWDFGDGVVVSNRPWASHAWAPPGEYVVELRAYNESFPAGVAATVAVHVVVQPVHYVALANANPVPPYSSWATAAPSIQDAVDAATVAGALVLVTNGLYQNGARAVYGMSNRVAVTKPVTVRSVNGPAVTSIVGYQVPGMTNGPAAVRCVYLTNATALCGFTLTNGATQTSGDERTMQSGGGVWCESGSAVLSNCVLTSHSAPSCGGGAYFGTLKNCTLMNNSAFQGAGAEAATLKNCTLTRNSAYRGGGAADGPLNNCTLTGNSATEGGGADSCTLNNCTLTGNSASSSGGGAAYGALYNCIVYYNTAPTGGNYYYGTLIYCCTMPLAPGPGNFTNVPLFVDTNGWSNLRLQSNSPCIDTGNNGYVNGDTDLDARPRIVGGTVDIGAYEFQGPGMSEFIAWLEQHGLPTDGSADSADSDHDGHNNWQEWIVGTEPTNALSVLRMLSVMSAASAVTVTWSSVTNRTYALEHATNLGAAPAFSVLESNITGLPGTTSWTDANAASSAHRFYRVRVEN